MSAIKVLLKLIGGSRGRALCTLPLPPWDPNISFSHIFSPKSIRVGGWGPPPQRKILDPPLKLSIHSLLHSVWSDLIYYQIHYRHTYRYYNILSFSCALRGRVKFAQFWHLSPQVFVGYFVSCGLTNFRRGNV